MKKIIRKHNKTQTTAFKATVKANPQGYAFLIPEGKIERECDFFVPAKHLNGAFDRDVVLASPVKGGRDEARIIKILSRGRETLSGRFETDRGAGYVLVDDPAFASDVYIPLSLAGGAQNGDKVITEITSYPSGGMVRGKVTEVLGKDGDFFTEELSIIRGHGLRDTFPEYVEATAEKVAAENVSLGKRKDFRDLLTVTIDGEDTRDIDDAVSLEEKDGKFILGVHIADVSHYVKVNGCIDKEAYARGTSVYFPDRVLPMLPKALSNGACSLNENEDRYALSCIMTFGSDGKREKAELYESVIRSDKRMTYTEVAALLNGEADKSGYGEITPMLEGMSRLCTLLEKRQKARGGVDLDIKEAHIYLDERGEIVIPDVTRTIAHRIIEQFMIAANEAVAQFAERRKAPFLYRIHEQPTPEKARLLIGFARDLGIKVTADEEDVQPADYLKILKLGEDKPYAPVLKSVMLRSMQKARYSEVNAGHFGLASDCYCHFTSPIRRYPDLFVHRVLKLLLKGGDAEAKEKFLSVAGEAAKSSSDKERLADVAERDVDDLYKLAYMEKRIGEEYDAVISGVIESGIFAQLPNTIEGMIRLESLPYDRYRFYGDKFLLKGTRRSYRLGDRIRVKVAGCDFGTRKVQFLPV